MDEGKKQPETARDGDGWQYKSESPAAAPFESPAVGPDAFVASKAAPDDGSVEWSASEFAAHDKGFGWYALLAAGTVVVAAIIYFITRDAFSTGVVVLLAAILGVAGARKPRVLTYRLNGSGVTIGNRFHSYGEYKSFALSEEEPFTSVILVPMKRFGFPLGIYLAPETEHQVVEALSRHLPLERGGLDSIERLMRRLRF